MSLFGRLFKGKPKEEEKVEIEKVSIEGLSSKLDEKIQEYSEKDKHIKEEVLESIKKFEIALNEAISVLEKKDISQRKEFEHLKRLTKDNLELYIGHLKKLLSNIKRADDQETKNQTNRIIHTLNDFNKTSSPYFERATILIGKELEAVRTILRDFAKEIENIAKNNKSLFEEKDLNNALRDLIQGIKENNGLLMSVDSHIVKLKKELDDSKGKYTNTKNKIEEIKTSDSRKNDLEEKKTHEEKLNELEKNIRDIKAKIDFKLLIKYFHFDKKSTKIVQDYFNNFKSALENDANLEIIEIVKKVQNIDLEELREIRKKLLIFNQPWIIKSDLEINILEENLKKLQSEIENLEENMKDELKKKERLNEKGKEIKINLDKSAKNLFPNIEIH